MGRDKTENQMVVAITVTYNRTRTLERCLQALLAQSRPVDKILVVDNRKPPPLFAWLLSYPLTENDLPRYTFPSLLQLPC